ncbi:DUF397 domain-containing protein [Streptomyces sp. NPDC005395]|uniref:DUF397 domain-containing protein n=1 Tax=Streptomyces sp. NPDC005395 TaxID=3157042 RepID=UPI0033B83029
MNQTRTVSRSTDFAPETAWRKASYSDQQGGNCVEVAEQATAVGVRDSKVADGPALVLSKSAFSALIGSISA